MFVFLLLEMMFLLQDSMFEINCCGIITAWEFYSCAPGVVQFMVWSLVSGSTYVLKAIQEVHVTGRWLKGGYYGRCQVLIAELLTLWYLCNNFLFSTVTECWVNLCFVSVADLGTSVNYTIPEENRIAIVAGDRIGWYVGRCSIFLRNISPF